MEFEQLISERYSVRSFRSEHLPKAVIDQILRVGHKAPTGCNYQPQRILVMNTDESIANVILTHQRRCLCVITRRKAG